MKIQIIFWLMVVVCASCNEIGNSNTNNSKKSLKTDSIFSKVYVRKNIYSLKNNDPLLLALKMGVAEMKKRKRNDPTSWEYQAAIHGTYLTERQDGWNSCQHGTFFFLSWHRMYLFYFERILRKASNYPDFALPYWNYSDSESQKVLPLVFRSPSDNSNPLYESKRNKYINQGSPLQPSSVAYLDEMNEKTFSSANQFAPGFGGVTVSAPIHFHFPHGRIENQPHDQVHGNIEGYMSDPNTAALDPIFYLHHANIDRLWEKWISMGNGRADPNDQNWLNTKFTFFDENGSKVEMSGKEILAIEDQLGYRYDDIEIFKPEKFIGKIDTITKPQQEKRLTLLKSKNITTRGIRTNIGFSKSQFKEFKKFASSNNLVKNRDQDQERVLLELEGITYDTMPNGVYEVYLNLPVNQTPKFGSPYYAGNIGLFGFMSSHSDHDKNMNMGGTVILDVTNTIQKLLDATVDLKDLQVSIIHKGATPEKDSEIRGEIQIRSVAITRVQR